MAANPKCPVCEGPLVESGMVENLGLIYMCDRDECSSHSEQHDCKDCGHPTAFVWVPDQGAADETAGTWERKCFDPLCKTA